MSAIELNYQARFGWMISTGHKKSTIRRRGKAKPGDTLVHKCSGMQLGTDICTGVDEVYMTESGFKLNGTPLLPHIIETIAIADGFRSVEEFRSFFRDTYGFPFSGELITWP